MRTFSLLMCCGQNQTATIDWSPIIKSAPCICWGIIGLIALYFMLKYVAAPLIANWHENWVKTKNFNQEKFWTYYKRMEKPIEEELKKAQKELNELKYKQKELDKGKSALDKEKENFEKQILEEKVKVYQEIIKNK